MITSKLLKLAKMLLKLAQVETDKGVLVAEDELAEGVEVFVENEAGELEPAADGEYIAEEKVYVVAEGKIAEIKEKEADPDPANEPEPEPEAEALSKQKFNAIKEKFEASYQEVENNIYNALAAEGINAYIIENTETYAIVSAYDEEDMSEHLYRYDITVAEDGTVTLGDKKAVHIEYVVEGEEKPAEENTEKDEEIERLKAELNAKDEELKKAQEFADQKPAFKDNTQHIENVSLAEAVQNAYKNAK